MEKEKKRIIKIKNFHSCMNVYKGTNKTKQDNNNNKHDQKKKKKPTTKTKENQK